MKFLIIFGITYISRTRTTYLHIITRLHSITFLYTSFTRYQSKELAHPEREKPLLPFSRTLKIHFTTRRRAHTQACDGSNHPDDAVPSRYLTSVARRQSARTIPRWPWARRAELIYMLRRVGSGPASRNKQQARREKRSVRVCVCKQRRKRMSSGTMATGTWKRWHVRTFDTHAMLLREAESRKKLLQVVFKKLSVGRRDWWKVALIRELS